ncbi:hypothetical protein DdX_19421 [Ditylenchus destructor]|uniref:Secreted protein n=1 Tax=Ditylenchus destructor TaxID=166010 RepID=A0AAD4MJP9_9BILA|nr:hypothetical protein DdX_19421 [Ditylenchus destructor]
MSTRNCAMLLFVYCTFAWCIELANCHNNMLNSLGSMWSSIISWITGTVQCPNLPARFYAPTACDLAAGQTDCSTVSPLYQCTLIENDKYYCCPP